MKYTFKIATIGVGGGGRGKNVPHGTRKKSRLRHHVVIIKILFIHQMMH